MSKLLVAAALVALIALVVATVRIPAHASHGLQVVAAENMWGSLAAQLAGSRARVTSVIVSPATDPHDYEPTAADARAVAEARLVVVNGAGYDSWADKLVAANPASGRIVLNVASLAHVPNGGNPHRWYSPTDVRSMIGTLTRDYSRLDPRDAAYFERRRARLETHGLARYTQLIASIRSTYRGVPIGASESIFAPLAHALGLNLVTPARFLRAISEGTEPAVADTATAGRQITRREIAVWVENSQNATPDVKRLTAAARSRGIPVVEITETLAPASATFQSWQSAQLTALAGALAKGTGR